MQIKIYYYNAKCIEDQFLVVQCIVTGAQETKMAHDQLSQQNGLYIIIIMKLCTSMSNSSPIRKGSS